MNVYLLEFVGVSGTHYTVKLLFTTRSKAEKYASARTFINTSSGLEAISTTIITRCEVL